MIRLRREKNETGLPPKIIDDYSVETGNQLKGRQNDASQRAARKSGGTLNLRADPEVLRSKSRRRRLRRFIAEQIYALVYAVLQLLFSFYLFLRQSYHTVLYRILDLRSHHYRTPAYIENDAKRLEKLPEHLSVIFELQDRENGNEELVNNASEIAAWTAAAGIPMLSIYESTGMCYFKSFSNSKRLLLTGMEGFLKHNLSNTFSRMQYILRDYFGPNTPSLTLCAPNFSPLTSPGHPLNPNAAPLTVILLSLEDGRDTLVDLTRTLAAMAQRNKISPDDITADIVDAEVSESVAPEPDLLIISGSTVKLSGYPPWQIRLTEI